MKNVKKLESVKNLFEENQNLAAIILGGRPGGTKPPPTRYATGAIGTMDTDDDIKITL